MVDPQHAHLRPAAGTGALDGGARLVKHIDVAARPGRHGGRAFHFCATGPNARKVVAHATATAHGLGSLAQRFIDAWVAVVIHTLDAIADGLHKTVDQGGLD